MLKNNTALMTAYILWILLHIMNKYVDIFNDRIFRCSATPSLCNRLRNSRWAEISVNQTATDNKWKDHWWQIRAWKYQRRWKCGLNVLLSLLIPYLKNEVFYRCRFCPQEFSCVADLLYHSRQIFNNLLINALLTLRYHFIDSETEFICDQCGFKV